MKLQNKVAFVTGAAQGMGLAIARRFVEEGARVVAADINLDSLREGLGELGDKVVPVVCNVADSASVAEAVKLAEKHFGRLDILVNNAGVGGLDSFLDTPDESWQRVIGVNLTGFYCARESARLMVKGGAGGSIINLSSTSALTGEGPNHYCASKAGIMGLTRGIARELAGHGIRVNTLVPGPTDTPMMAGIPDDMMADLLKAVPLGLCGTDEIARVATFLAGEDASFITGQNIAVNGGMAFI